MKTISEILEELNLENGSNYKKAVLEKYKDNELLKRVLKQCYDRVSYTFGITMKNINYSKHSGKNSLEYALTVLEQDFSTRNVTGNAALAKLTETLESLSAEDAIVIEKILDRDLKIRLGRTEINKVFKNLIIKPLYMRCGIFTTDKLVNGKIKKGTASKISFPAIINLKADGTYREISKIENTVESISRSGEKYSYPFIEESFSKIEQEGYFTGELTVRGNDEIMQRILPKIEKEDIKNGTDLAETIKKNYETAVKQNKEYILPRSIGNGLINSSEVPQKNIVYEVWDYITPEDYKLAALKDRKNKPKIKYIDRFNSLKEIIQKIDNNNIRVIEHKVVKNLKEATEFTSEKMKEGLEGAILKDFNMLYKDGTNDLSLKLKIQIDADMRVSGFIEGRKGTKREKTFGSLIYQNDEGTIMGSVSGFTDSELKEINSNRNKYTGKIITVEFNDITQGIGNKHYALSHPRFIEFRNDKNETDTLKRCLEMKDMAMNLV